MGSESSARNRIDRFVLAGLEAKDGRPIPRSVAGEFRFAMIREPSRS